MAEVTALQEQRLSALAVANALRSERRELKFQIRKRAIDPGALIEELPSAIARVRVYEFLMWLPWVGGTRARSLIREAGVPDIALERLGRASRARLAAVVAAAMSRRVVSSQVAA
jgi:hypothetical protein